MRSQNVIPLNRSRSSRDRYYLILDGKGMGGYGNPPDHYTNRYVVANGVNRGRGYQGYLCVDYAVGPETSYIPDEVKAAILQVIPEARKSEG